MPSRKVVFVTRTLPTPMVLPDPAWTGVLKVLPSSVDLVTKKSALVVLVPMFVYATYRSPEGSTAGWLNWSRSWSIELETIVFAGEKVSPRSRETAARSLTVLPTLPSTMSQVAYTWSWYLFPG